MPCARRGGLALQLGRQAETDPRKDSLSESERGDARHRSETVGSGQPTLERGRRRETEEGNGEEARAAVPDAESLHTLRHLALNEHETRDAEPLAGLCIGA